jgi:hypothetical protein
VSTPVPDWAKLGREIETLSRRVVSGEKNQGRLADLIEELATSVATLTARAGPESTEIPRSLLLLRGDPVLFRTLVDDLAVWLHAVYLRFEDATLTQCWWFHPDVVEELWWVRCAHREAFHPHRGGITQIADWHDRSRPHVAERVNRTLSGCELNLHLAGGPRNHPAEPVPLSELNDLDHLTEHWTHTPDQPIEPTNEQQQRADEAEKERRTGNGY